MNLAGVIEHTALSADVTRARVERLAAEAIEHGFVGICVAPCWVATAARLVGDRARVVSVIGFPLGSTTSAVKAEEARRAHGDGAVEIDMVMALGAALGGEWDTVRADIQHVREAARSATLKVIVETGYLDAEQLRTASESAVGEGADYVKTCTGFGPRGATVEDVIRMKHAIGGRARIKASGGIRTIDDVRRLLTAGADRIGTSAGVAILGSSG